MAGGRPPNADSQRPDSPNACLYTIRLTPPTLAIVCGVEAELFEDRVGVLTDSGDGTHPRLGIVHPERRQQRADWTGR